MNMRYLMLMLILLSSAGYARKTGPGKDLSIEDAISTAVKNNPQIKISREKIAAAQGRIWSGVSLPAPEISLSYDYVPSGRPLSAFGERTFSVAQAIEFPSVYFLRHSKFTGEKLIAERELSQAELSVTSSVKSAYYNALAKQEELKLAKENLSIAEDFHIKAGIRFKAGEATYLEDLTAKVQYTEAVNILNVKQNELMSAFSELNFSMGLGKSDAKENYFLSDSLGFSEEKYSFEKLTETASGNNQQIKIAELKLSASLAEKKLAWTALMPEFNLSYFKQSRDGVNSFYGASFGITLPLWFMFDQRGKISEAEANESIAESELTSTKNESGLRVTKAYNDYLSADGQVRLYRSDILPQSGEIYRAALKSYEAGEISYLEFLQAKQTVQSSKSNYIAALLSYNQAITALEEAVGKRINKL